MLTTKCAHENKSDYTKNTIVYTLLYNRIQYILHTLYTLLKSKELKYDTLC